MRREKPPGRQKGARLFSMLLAVCLMIAALPLSVSAAGEYVPGNSHRLCQCNVSDESVYVHFQCDFICNRWKKFSVRN